MNHSRFRWALCSVLLVVATSASRATWNKITQFSRVGHVSAAYFFDDRVGLVGFDSGTRPNSIRRTTDGGFTWRSVLTPPYAEGVFSVTDIWFKNKFEGWATFYDKTVGVYTKPTCALWHSTDGGLSWTEAVTTLQFQDFGCVRETSKAVIAVTWGVQPPYGVTISTDGGRNFTSSSKGMDGIDFVDDLHGAGTGWGGSPFYYTSDGGLTWQPAVTNIKNEAWGIYGFKGTGTLVAAGEGGILARAGYIYRSTDYGKDWSIVQTMPKMTGGIGSDGTNLYIQFLDENGGGVYRSSDTGLTWKPVGGPGNYYDCRFAVNSCTIFAFDFHGGVYVSTDGGDGTVTPNCPTLATLRASVCDSARYRFLLQGLSVEENGSNIIDVRIIDSSAASVSTSAVTLDSLPDPSRVVHSLDTIPFVVRWRPGLVTDSGGQYTVTVRVILKTVGVDRFDTSFYTVHLFATSNIPDFTLSNRFISRDSILRCTETDTVLTIANSACDSLTITSAALTGNTHWSLVDSLGMTLITPFTIPSGAVGSIGVHFSPDTVSNSRDTVRLTFRQFGKDTASVVMLSGSTLAPDTLRFHLRITPDPVAVASFVRVMLLPDRTIPRSGLNSITGVFELPFDAVDSVSLSAVSGSNLVVTGPSISPSFSGSPIARYSFQVTGTPLLPIDSSVALVTLSARAVTSVSPQNVVTLDSLVVNGGSKAQGNCTLDVSAPPFVVMHLAKQCGDTLLREYLLFGGFLSAGRPQPNPVTAGSDYRSTITIQASEEGVAQISVVDALGRLRSTESQQITTGMNYHVLECSQLEAGSYFYSIRFRSTSGETETRGSVVLLK